MTPFGYVILAVLVVAIFVAYKKGQKSIVIPKQQPVTKLPKIGFEEAELILERANENSIEVNSENTTLIQLVLGVLDVKNNVKQDAEGLIAEQKSKETRQEENAKETEMAGKEKLSDLQYQIESLKLEVEETKKETTQKVNFYRAESENARERTAEIQKTASLF